jgi:hypothetical protein
MEATARRAGEGYGKHDPLDVGAQEQSARDRATIASEFDPAEITHGRHAAGAPSVLVAFLPLIVVKDIFVVAIVGALLALAAVVVLGSIFGSF